MAVSVVIVLHDRFFVAESAVMVVGVAVTVVAELAVTVVELAVTAAVSDSRVVASMGVFALESRLRNTICRPQC